MRLKYNKCLNVMTVAFVLFVIPNVHGVMLPEDNGTGHMPGPRSHYRSLYAARLTAELIQRLCSKNLTAEGLPQELGQKNDSQKNSILKNAEGSNTSATLNNEDLKYIQQIVFFRGQNLNIEQAKLALNFIKENQSAIVPPDGSWGMAETIEEFSHLLSFIENFGTNQNLSFEETLVKISKELL